MYLGLYLPCGLFPSGVPNAILYALLFASCVTHVQAIIDLISPITFA